MKKETHTLLAITGFGDWADGHILLQDHGNAASFRNVKIRELPGQ